MSEFNLAPRVRSFIDEHVDSVEKLEILLLLRSRPADVWTGARVSSELRSSDISATRRLEQLERRGLLKAEPGAPVRFRYAPRDARLAEDVDLVAEAYQVARVRVIGCIYARSEDRAQSFADAFRIGKKGEGDG